MDQQVEALLVEIKNMCPTFQVEYTYVNLLHKLRFTSEYHPHRWLYIDSDFFSDNSVQELLMNLINQEKFETFIKSPQSIWLFLSQAGVSEVDENFSKIY